MVYIKTDEAGRLTALADPGFHCGEGEIAVELPDDFDTEHISDWKLVEDSLVYDPLPVKPAEEPTDESERINALEKKVEEQAAMLAAYEAAYTEGVQSV